MRNRNIYVKRKPRKSGRRIRRKYGREKLILVIIAVFIGVTFISELKEKFNIGKNNVQAYSDREAGIKDNDSNLGEDLNNESDEKEDSTVKKDPNADDVAVVEKYLNAQLKGQPIKGTDNKKVVYMTFDDGPSETVTPKVLKTLKNENVKATFFVLGKSIDQSAKNRELLKQEVQDGHAIGNHTYSHDYKNLYPGGSISSKNFMAEINKTNQSLKSVLGQDFVTRAIRFPGGHMSWKNSEQVDKEMAENDYHYIDWNALSKDAEGAKKNAAQLLEEVKKTVGSQKKVVLLMHDTYGKEETARALPDIIKYLKNNGYEFKTFK